MPGVWIFVGSVKLKLDCAILEPYPSVLWNFERKIVSSVGLRRWDTFVY